MRPIKVSYTPAALNATGFANSVAVGGDLTYPLSATTAGDGLAHQVTFKGDAATNHSAKTVTIVGTDADDRAQSVGIAGPNGAVTVTTTGTYFKTVTRVSISSTTGADTFDIGWDQVSVGPTIPLEWRSNAPAGIHVDVSGTINWTIEQTFANVYGTSQDSRVPGAAPSTMPWAPITTPVDLDDITADATGSATLGATAMRFFVNTVTGGATASVYVSQPGGYMI